MKCDSKTKKCVSESGVVVCGGVQEGGRVYVSPDEQIVFAIPKSNSINYPSLTGATVSPKIPSDTPLSGCRNVALKSGKGIETLPLLHETDFYYISNPKEFEKMKNPFTAYARCCGKSFCSISKCGVDVCTAVVEPIVPIKEEVIEEYCVPFLQKGSIEGTLEELAEKKYSSNPKLKNAVLNMIRSMETGESISEENMNILTKKGFVTEYKKEFYEKYKCGEFYGMFTPPVWPFVETIKKTEEARIGEGPTRNYIFKKVERKCYPPGDMPTAGSISYYGEGKPEWKLSAIVQKTYSLDEAVRNRQSEAELADARANIGETVLNGLIILEFIAIAMVPGAPIGATVGSGWYLAGVAIESGAEIALTGIEVGCLSKASCHFINLGISDPKNKLWDKEDPNVFDFVIIGSTAARQGYRLTWGRIGGVGLCKNPALSWKIIKDKVRSNDYLSIIGSFKKNRANQISILRENGRLMGDIYYPYIKENQRVISELADAAKDADLVLGTERGGSLVADLIKARRCGYLNIQSISKMTSDLQIRELKSVIERFIAKNPNKPVTIAITDSIIGGGSANQLVKNLKPYAKGNVKIKFLFRHQTLGKSPNQIEALEGVISRETGNPNLKIHISRTPFIIGEDINLASRKPVTIFRDTTINGKKEVEETIISDGNTYREIVLDLLGNPNSCYSR